MRLMENEKVGERAELSWVLRRRSHFCTKKSPMTGSSEGKSGTSTALQEWALPLSSCASAGLPDSVAGHAHGTLSVGFP